MPRLALPIRGRDQIFGERIGRPHLAQDLAEK
jgi:hypothetical protein